MVAILQTWWWVVVRGIEKPVRLLAADAGDDLFLDRSGGLLVAVELQGVGGSTLSARAQLGRVAEHLRQRAVGADDLAAATLVHAPDPAPTRADVADAVAKSVPGPGDLARHGPFRPPGPRHPEPP